MLVFLVLLLLLFFVLLVFLVLLFSKKTRIRTQPPQKISLLFERPPVLQLFHDKFDEILKPQSDLKSTELDDVLKQIKFDGSIAFDILNEMTRKQKQKVNIINGMLMVLDWHQWDIELRVNKNALKWILMKYGYVSPEWQHIHFNTAGKLSSSRSIIWTINCVVCSKINRTSMGKLL